MIVARSRPPAATSFSALGEGVDAAGNGGRKYPRCGVADRKPAIIAPLRRQFRATAWLLAVFLAALAPLSAHDLYSSWTETFVRRDRLEVTLTLARAAALRLLPDAAKLAPITPENFSDYTARLREAAPGLFEITAANKPLKLDSVEVKISGDADITFHLTYPPVRQGPLRFVVQYLFQQVDGHTGTLVVNDHHGKDLGWSPVSVDQPVFELKLPSLAAPKP